MKSEKMANAAEEDHLISWGFHRRMQGAEKDCNEQLAHEGMAESRRAVRSSTVQGYLSQTKAWELSSIAIFGFVDAAADRDPAVVHKLGDVCPKLLIWCLKLLKAKVVFECIWAEWPSGCGTGELSLEPRIALEANTRIRIRDFRSATRMDNRGHFLCLIMSGGAKWEALIVTTVNYKL